MSYHGPGGGVKSNCGKFQEENIKEGYGGPAV
jgi:hypothetical protein